MPRTAFCDSAFRVTGNNQVCRITSSNQQTCYTSCAFDCSSTLAFGLANQPPRVRRSRPRSNSSLRGTRVKNIFVGNLDFNTSEDDLRKLFEVHGQVDRVSIMTDRD